LALQALWNILVTAVAIGGHHLTVLAAAIGRQLAILLQPLIARLERPNIGGPIALGAAIALALGIGRYSGTGFDREAGFALALGLVLLIAALPLMSNLTGIGLPRFSALGIPPRMAAFGVVAAAAVAGVVWMSSGGGRTSLAGITSQLPLIGGAKPLLGRAEALGGDLLRVAGTTVRLAGIEAPASQQSCGTGSKRYRCGAAAQAALSKLVSGRTIACTASGTDSSGHPLATCTRGELEINGELVRQGQVFAGSGIFSGYSGLERQARDAKAGIWATGEVERPSEFRAKAWEEAKRRAPDGCPIKGLVSGGERVYVLPGSPDYERGRIQKARGERWFCSEREAEAAG
jgi:endonuclease YncB( thermonuclease family)